MLKTERVVEGKTNLSELFDEYGDDEGRARRHEIAEALSGVRGDGEFRVPAADTGHELFFNNRELLTRFTSMPKPLQEMFLHAVRFAMAKEEVDTLNLTIAWSSQRTRVIKIRRLNAAGCLNIDT